MKKFVSALIIVFLCTFSLVVSCTKERTDPPVVKKTYTTYYFMIEEVDNDGSVMYSPITTLRK